MSDSLSLRSPWPGGALLLVLSACGAAEELRDRDGDGFPAAQDCDDFNRLVHPDAIELCNGLDDDCDGVTDDGDAAGAGGWYLDLDGDGFGAEEVATCDGGGDPDLTRQGGDCDDADPMVTGPQRLFTDSDGDGYGDAGSEALACVGTAGLVDNDRDCDDSDAEVSPAALETCDGVDEDCDGAVDEDAVDATAWYVDADGDGHGDPARPALACPRDGLVEGDADCDDADADVAPGALEVCDDGVDNDCNGRRDEVQGWLSFPTAEPLTATSVRLGLYGTDATVSYAPDDAACALGTWDAPAEWTASGQLWTDDGVEMAWAVPPTFLEPQGCATTVSGTLAFDFGHTAAEAAEAPGWRWALAVARAGGGGSFDEGPTSIVSSEELTVMGVSDPGETGVFAGVLSTTTLEGGQWGPEDGLTWLLLPEEATAVTWTLDDGGTLDAQVFVVGLAAPTACGGGDVEPTR